MANDRVLDPLRVKFRAENDTGGDWAARGLVWIPDKETGEAYVAAAIKSESGETCQCEREDNKQIVTVNRVDIQKMNPPRFKMSEDMAKLTVLNEASVLYNLKDRYYADLIYTYSGLFCVVVNPYKNLPIYSEDVIMAYKGTPRNELPPHVYAIADESYRHMMQEKGSQSILCTGESGAGKTENTKKVIQYLANIAAGGARKSAQDKVAEARRRRSSIGVVKMESMSKGELEMQLLKANPILETFGNAATLKNDNSSRFGKFIKIHFDGAGLIVGGTIKTYLLEKSRAVLQNKKERNFHAFYQLLKGADSSLAQEFYLTDISKYRFMSQGDMKLNNMSDTQEFANTNSAFSVMHFTPDDIKNVWRVVAAVLQFGQLVFENQRRSEQAYMPSDEEAQKLCFLLGINCPDFCKYIVNPSRSVGKAGSFTAQQSKKAVEYAVEALAKATYDRLFLWIVRRINDTLNKKVRDARTFIGILDIAGFEIFEFNSFEQLCINYTNEKLQQLFNHKMFIMEQDEYKNEHIDWEFIDFGLDLQPTIDLIERQSGVLALVDEQCFFPVADDNTLLNKFVEMLGKDPHFVKPGLREKDTFGIKHYAGTVKYTTTNWLDKNKDPLNENIVQLLSESSNTLVNELWGEEMSRLFSSGTRKGTFRTVGYIYKDQLTQLMDTLNSTNPNFVRCIIPNHQKRPGFIDGPLVEDQLKCNGVLEGIRICRKGFPSRILFQEFKQRFAVLCPEVVPRGIVNGRQVVENMVKALQLDENSYRMGTTKIFFRAGVLYELEEQRNKKLSGMMVGLQARCRGFIARKYHNTLRIGSNAILIIQRNARAYLQLRSWPWWKLYTRVKPLLQVSRGDEELRLLREELADLKNQLAKKEEMYKTADEAREALEAEKRRIMEELKRSNDELESSFEERMNLKTRNVELDKELRSMEEKMDEDLERLGEVVAQNKALQAECDTLKKDISAGIENEERIARLEKKIADLQTALSDKTSENETLEAAKRAVEKDIRSVQDRLDDAVADKTKAEKARTKLAQELDDVTTACEQESIKVTNLESRQRTFDQQMKDLKSQIDSITDQRDKAESDSRNLQTSILNLKSELQEAIEKTDSLEKQKKRLQESLDEAMANMAGNNLAEVEKAKRNLQTIVDDQKQQIIELEDDLMIAERDSSQLKITVHALEEKLANISLSAEVEDENKRRQLSRQIKDLEEELAEERTAKTRITTEKRKLEIESKNLQDQLEEEMRMRARDQLQLKKMEKRLKGFIDGDGVDNSDVSREMEKLRARIRTLKSELNEAEDNISKSNSARRRAERELEENHEMTSTYEAEISSLRAQIRRLRAQQEALTISEDMPPGTSIEYTIEETVTSTNDA